MNDLDLAVQAESELGCQALSAKAAAITRHSPDRHWLTWSYASQACSHGLREKLYLRSFVYGFFLRRALFPDSGWARFRHILFDYPFFLSSCSHCGLSWLKHFWAFAVEAGRRSHDQLIKSKTAATLLNV